MSDADKALFNKIYDELLKERGNCNILLQTYFGDVRDIYEDIINKPFAGVGLDFNEGRKTFELVEKYGFQLVSFICWCCKWKEYMEEQL